MKIKLLALLLAAMMMFACAVHAEEGEALSGVSEAVFEAVKWNADFPKDAQVKRAMEYFCKVEGHQLRLLLIEATQNETVEMMHGIGTGAMLVDTQTGECVTYANAVWPESPQINSRQDALNMVFSCYASWLEGMNEWIFADHELAFPLTQEEIDAVNESLSSHFLR